MQFVLEWIRNLVVCVVLIAVIMQLLPAQTVSKYMKVVTGILLMLVIISPVIRVLHMEKSIAGIMDQVWEQVVLGDLLTEKNGQELRQFERDAVIYREQFESKLTAGENSGAQKQIQQILSEYQMELMGCRISYDLEYDSKTYGKVTALTLEAKMLSDKIKGSGIREVRERIARMYQLKVNRVKLTVNRRQDSKG